MRRALIACFVLLAAPLAAPMATAQDGIEPGSVWTVYVTVEASIEDNYAIVDVIADIGNRGPDPEFPFQVLVPDGAFVSGLTVERDGITYEADVKEREQARQEYEEHKENQQTGALIEQQRGTQRYAFLVNVAEQESVRATLRYETYVHGQDGAFTLPLQAPVSGFGRDLGAAFDVTIRHSDGVGQAWGSHGSASQTGGTWRLQHDVGGRGEEEETLFTAFYDLPATGDAGSLVGRDGAFVHRFRAPADGDALPVDMVMVLDTSGSMSGLKIDQLKDAARQVIGHLDEDDRIQIIDFDSQATPAWSQMRHADAATRDDALQVIDALLAGGSTHIEDGLREGFASFIDDDCDASELPVVGSTCPERSLVLAFLTDGQASSGITDTPGLRALAKEANDRGSRLYGLAFGHGSDWGLVAGLARDQGGAAWQVPTGAGAEVDLRRWMALLTTPHLEDIQVAYEQSAEAYGTGAPVLFAGSELLIVGETSAQRLSGTVTGTARDGAREYAFDEAIGQGPAHLPRLVAAARITDMQQRLDADGPNETLRQTLVDLAMEFGFVTQHTSLVLTLEAVRPWSPGSGSGADGDGFADAAMTSGSPRPAPSPAPAPSAAPLYDSSPGGSGGGEGDATSTPGPAVGLLALAVFAAAWRRRR